MRERLGDNRPRIALIHAVTVAMDPIASAFASGWPEAECVNVLDDSLSPDRARDDALTPAMAQRISDLADYAFGIGSDSVLFTCSAFGPAIEAVAARSERLVLKPNEAMFAKALQLGSRIGMLATFPPSVASMEAEFGAEAAAHGVAAHIETLLVEGALDALKSGDAKAHNRLLAEAAPRLAGSDAILLAHFSTSRARAAVEAVVDVPVLTSPESAVDALRSHALSSRTRPAG